MNTFLMRLFRVQRAKNAKCSITSFGQKGFKKHALGERVIKVTTRR